MSGHHSKEQPEPAPPVVGLRQAEKHGRRRSKHALVACCGAPPTLSRLLAQLVSDLAFNLGLLALHTAPHKGQVQQEASQ